MAIYTKTGDKGKTGLLGGKRVSKTDPIIMAYGSVDELNAVIGLIRSFGVPKDIDTLLERIQNDLFNLGVSFTIDTLHPKETEFLEKKIDFYDAKNSPLRNFILPGGTKTASLFHVARTICRRAEREVIRFLEKEKTTFAQDLFDLLVPYLNRLSDLLFVLARYENNRKKIKEKIW